MTIHEVEPDQVDYDAVAACYGVRLRDTEPRARALHHRLARAIKLSRVVATLTDAERPLLWEGLGKDRVFTQRARNTGDTGKAA
jgi:hypothetical protein